MDPFDFARRIDSWNVRLIRHVGLCKLYLNLAPTHQWDLFFRDRWLTISYTGREGEGLAMDRAWDFVGDLVTEGLTTLDRGFAIFRSGTGAFVFVFTITDFVLAEMSERFRLPSGDTGLAGFLGVEISVTFALTAFFTVFVLPLSLTFVCDLTTVALTTLPFLSCALTVFFNIFMILPLTTRFTFEATTFLPFFGETTGGGLGGGGIAFRFPMKPRQFSAPHLHFCSFAPSNHEKL